LERDEEGRVGEWSRAIKGAKKVETKLESKLETKLETELETKLETELETKLETELETMLETNLGSWKLSLQILTGKSGLFTP
jgi:hypothetical protein